MARRSEAEIQKTMEVLIKRSMAREKDREIIAERQQALVNARLENKALEFYKIVYMNRCSFLDIDSSTFFKPVIERLYELLAHDTAEELDEMLAACGAQAKEFYAADGMDLAIDIMNGNYKPAF